MDLEQKAIERLKQASKMSLQYYGKPLVCTYSGGKDSDVMVELFKRSGIKFEVHNSHTTADAPQTVYHIREVFRRLELLEISILPSLRPKIGLGIMVCGGMGEKKKVDNGKECCGNCKKYMLNGGKCTGVRSRHCKKYKVCGEMERGKGK